MNTDPLWLILSRLETGFRLDAARLEIIENEVGTTLQRARRMLPEADESDPWKTGWNRQWNDIERMLLEVREQVELMSCSMAGSATNDLSAALHAWEIIRDNDIKLTAALHELRGLIPRLTAEAQENWAQLTNSLQSHLETIQACAQALRTKLEFIKHHSREEVERLVADVLEELTRAEAVPGEDAGQHLRRAAAQIDQEHHRFLGFMDVVKGLFMWVETPEERALKNNSPAPLPEAPPEVLPEITEKTPEAPESKFGVITP